MRAIHKGAEPQSLVEHRAASHSDFDNYKHSDELRESLVAEQGAICCYCLQRIRPTAEGMKIEHWHCQTKYPAEQLDYGNLLAIAWVERVNLRNPSIAIRERATRIFHATPPTRRTTFESVHLVFSF